mgnify:CR=1 FL=1
MRVFNLTIGSLVDENYIYARALSYLGVDFYDHHDRKLLEICEEMNITKDQVLKAFYLFDQSHRFSFKELNKLPLQIVIEYLKHAHQQFIKDKLPYIARLIARHQDLDDLKLIFPEFVDEFVNHIYEEEDTLFHYLDTLIKIDKGQHANPLAALWKHRSMRLKDVFEDHQEVDELAGIRNLAEEYQDQDILARVILQEIKAFDREMWYHAEIENKILFPKAIELEGQIWKRLTKLTRLN